MADKYGRTMYQIMLENGATEDELRQRLEGRGTAQSYIDREAQKAAAAAAAQPTYAIPAQNFDGMARMGASGGWTIDDSESATWQKIAQMANSGDTQGAINLANQLSAAGKFGGYWDDAGNYWGFAQGYTGGANASMQPVIGGKMLTPKGLEYENTGVWLTPDGTALNLGANGTLTNNGETWGTTDNRNAQAVGRWYDENGTDSKDARWNTWDAVGARMGWTPEETFANMSKSGAFLNPALNTPQGNAAASNSGSSGMTWGGPGGTPYNPNEPTNMWGGPGGEPLPYDPNGPQMTPYQQVLNSYDSPSASLSAPGAYDPESDTLWQQYLKEYGNAKAPEYAGDPYQAQRDAALAAYGEKWGGSEYQPLRDQYLQNAANMEWNYNPDTDPVWQAYQKQYRREGQRAMEDTLGRVAGMTGGMPSSYAVTAASQAGNYYASQLSDKLPQLYQDAYNRYLQEYQRQLGLSDAYAGFDRTEYQRWLQGQQQNLDLADRYNQYGQTDYSRFLDTVDQFNKDRNFAYEAARDNQSLGWQQTEDQYSRYLDALKQANYEDETAYNRYRDTISDQRYDQEWAQQLREYADQQNWKATEWQQYLREYGDQLSQQEREWVYKQMQAANDQALDMAKLGAQYGDYTGLNNMGIDTSSAINKNYAYSADGSTYDISSAKGMDFLQNAPIGAAMTGGDGSRWTKNADGTTTITKNGKVWTYGSPAAPATSGSGKSSGGSGRGSGSKSGSGSGSGSQNSNTDDIFATLDSLGYTTVAQVSYALKQMGLPQDMSLSIAKEYVAGLNNGGDQGSAYDPTYANLEESLDRMAANNRSRDEIFTEIDAEVKDGRITKEQGDTLKNKYYGVADNVPNSNQTHSGGRPQSAGFNAAFQEAETYNDRGYRSKAIQAISDAYNAGKIHEYEIDIIMDRLGL